MRKITFELSELTFKLMIILMITNILDALTFTLAISINNNLIYQEFSYIAKSIVLENNFTLNGFVLNFAIKLLTCLGICVVMSYRDANKLDRLLNFLMLFCGIIAFSYGSISNILAII